MTSLYRMAKLGILSLALAGATASCGNGTPVQQQPTQIQSQTSTASRITLQDVIANRFTGQQYLDHTIQELRKGKTAEQSRAVDCALYDPSPAIIEQKTREKQAGVVPPDTLEQMIKAQAENFAGPSKGHPTIFPRNIYAGQVAVCIVFPSNTFKVSVKNDAETKSVADHEWKHAVDFFYGISYQNGVSITPEDLSNGTIGLRFFEAVNESRAFYQMLEEVFIASRNKAIAFSDGFTINNAIEYNKNYQAMILLAKTPKERQVLAAQLEELKGVRPAPLPDSSIEINYDLRGVNDKIVIRAK